MPPVLELAHRARSCAPLIEIAQQHRRESFVTPLDMPDDGPDLVAPAQAGQVEVDPDRAQPHAFDEKIAPHGAARLDPRQVDRVRLEMFEVLAHKQRVAVPAEALRPARDGQGAPRRLVERGERDHAFARAEAAVALLQRDHVGVEFAQDGEHAIRIALAVLPHRLVDVVTGERQLHVGIKRAFLANGPARSTSASARRSGCARSVPRRAPQHSSRASPRRM